MGLLKKILDPAYRSACGILKEKGFDLEDVTLGESPFCRVILNNKVILQSPYRNDEEMSYESFLIEAEKFKDLRFMLDSRRYSKTRNLLGVDIYEKGDKKWLLGRNVLFKFGNNKEKLTYDQAKAVLRDWW